MNIYQRIISEAGGAAGQIPCEISGNFNLDNREIRPQNRDSRGCFGQIWACFGNHPAFLCRLVSCVYRFVGRMCRFVG